VHACSTDQDATVGYRSSGQAGPRSARHERNLRFLKELEHPNELASIGREDRRVGEATGCGQRVGFVGDEPVGIFDHRPRVDSGP
jgi:hypothetical protein